MDIYSSNGSVIIELLVVEAADLLDSTPGIEVLSDIDGIWKEADVKRKIESAIEQARQQESGTK